MKNIIINQRAERDELMARPYQHETPDIILMNCSQIR